MAEMNPIAGGPMLTPPTVNQKNPSMLVTLGRYFKYKFGEMRKNWIYYVLLFPFALIFSAFTILPVITSIVLSFTTFDMVNLPKFVFTDNYFRLFMADDLFLTAIKNTMIFAVITGPGGYLASLGFAWLINEMPNKVRTVLTVLFYAPSISGGAMTIFSYIFSSDEYGLLNAFLLKNNIKTSIVPFLTDESTAPTCCIIVMLWLSLGTSFLSLIAGFQCVSKDYYEAGAIDGIKNRWQELWYITLPTMREHLMFAAVMSVTGAFGVGSVITSLVGNPSPNYCCHTIMHHLEDYQGVRMEVGYAAAISTLLFLLVVGCNQLIQKVLRKLGS